MLYHDYIITMNGIKEDIETGARTMTKIIEEPAEENYIKLFNGRVAIRKNVKGFIFVWEDEHDSPQDIELFGILTGLLAAIIPYIKAEISKSKTKLTIYDVLPAIDYSIEPENKYVLHPIDPETEAGAIIVRALDAQKYANKQARAKAARTSQNEARQKYKGNKEAVIHYNKRELTTDVVTTKLARTLFDKEPTFERDENTGELIVKNGRLLVKLDYSSKDKPEALLKASVTINFLELDYGYDFFVICALDQLFKEGNHEVTLSQILKRMGITPSQKELEKLYNSLVLGSSVHMRVDNQDIVKKWKINDPDFNIITGAVMFIQIEEKRRVIDGNLSKLTVKIGGYSPFYQVGKTLAQLAEWDNKLLELYTGYRTPKYWRIMRYLIREIGYMRSKKGKRNNILDIKEIYEFAGDRNGDDYESTRKTTYRILDDCFIGCHYIESYYVDNSTGNIIIKKMSDTKRQQMLLKERNDKK